MPELPEVETVRLGLQTHLVGRTIRDVEVLHPRAVRRHAGGDTDLIGRMRGKSVSAARRRGKYLWLDLADADDQVALVVHLGMSGQMLIARQGAPDHTHLRIRAVLDDADIAANAARGSGSSDSGSSHIGVSGGGVSGGGDSGDEVRFVDQRTFGGWHLDDYAADVPGAIPLSIAHIAPDPFDDAFDRAAVVTKMRSKHSEIKRILLDQTVISGVGNIYADEALWRARLHGARPADGISRAKLGELVDAATEVMSAALAVGGTSFDALYVNVNGQSGYFDRSLDAYGRDGEPCSRCGTTIKRETFMNRSSHFCPRCQRLPRRPIT